MFFELPDPHHGGRDSEARSGARAAAQRVKSCLHPSASSVPTRLGTQMTTQALAPLPPTEETRTEFRAPGFTPAAAGIWGANQTMGAGARSPLRLRHSFKYIHFLKRRLLRELNIIRAKAVPPSPTHGQRSDVRRVLNNPTPPPAGRRAKQSTWPAGHRRNSTLLLPTTAFSPAGFQTFGIYVTASDASWSQRRLTCTRVSASPAHGP